MSTAAAMPSTSANTSRPSQKRRISETPDRGAPEAKRARKNGEGGDPVEPGENAPPEAAADVRAAAKDKKKRKKKKRKQSIVSHTAGVDGAGATLATDVAPSPMKSTQKKRRHRSVAKNSTPGPSRVARSPSASPERARSLAPSSRAQSEAPVGKGRATSPAAAAAAPSADTAALASHRALLDNVLPSLTCQICLLLMSRPFALAPCGHVLCHGCLVNWFSNEPAAPLGQAVQQAEPPPAPAEGAGVNSGADNQGAAAAPAPASAARRPAPLIRRKKTCPHCRAVVREKPVEVWSIKDMVSAVVRSGLADPDAVPAELQGGGASEATADPWKDIFPDDTRGPFADMLRESMGLRDEEDGGIYRCVDCNHEIWDGVCSSCGRFYPGHRIEFDSDSQDDEDGLQPMWLDYSDEDDEADMEADMHFLRRIMGAGAFADLHDAGDDHHSEGGEGHHEDRFGWLAPNYSGSGSDTGSEMSEMSELSELTAGEEGEEGYESSFIDDDGDDEEVDVSSVRRVGRRYRADDSDDEPIVLSSDEDDAPRRVQSRRPIVVSDEEISISDEEEVAPQAARRGRRTIVSDEEQSEEDGDDDLAAAVAARERELYGDDGSLPSRRFTQGGSDSEDREDYIGDDDDEDGY